MSEPFDYGQKKPDGQYERHPTLPDEQRSGFVRPVRDSYKHVGCRPRWPTRPLTPEEQERYKEFNYVVYEEYPPDDAPLVGRFWTQKQLDSGCGGVTCMGRRLAETYAAKPDFYGSTYCSRCANYFPVGAQGEFVWIESNGAEGPRVGT